MSSNSLRKNNKHNISGFSLVEAMVSTVIVGIAFTGIYSLTIFSSKTLNSSADRQKLQLTADSIMEVIESDLANIDSYNMDFTTCNAPDSGENENYHQYRYKWCRMLNDQIGTAATGDEREITISDTIEGKLVTIKLESRNAETNIVMKRIFND